MKQNEIEIQCNFENSSKVYKCCIENQRIPSDFVLKFIGNHVADKTNKDVFLILFQKCVITKVPQGLLKVFPNLKTLSIANSNLRHISKSDLIEYKTFKCVYFGDNKLEFLSGELFEGFTKLERVSFANNKLRIIEPNLFDGLEKLSFVKLSGNPKGFGIFDLNRPGNDWHSDFSSFRRNFFDIFCSMSKDLVTEYLKKIDFKLEILKKRTINENETIKSEIENLKLENAELKRVKLSHDTSIQNFFKNDENLKDFTIKVNNCREFRVHKALMAAQSLTIAEMLAKNPKVASLNLVDIPVNIFETILKYIYNDELPQDENGNNEAIQPASNEINYMHLFAAAGNLRIENLKNFAATKIMEKNSFQNISEIYELGLKYKHRQLMEMLRDKINQSLSEM